MFLTWQFWNALRFPMWRHPIFIQARKQRERVANTSRSWRFLQVGSLVAISLLFFLFPTPAIVTSLGIIVGLPVLMIVFNGTILGAIWVTNISATIAHAHRQHHFDLLSLTPQGAYGVSWYLCTGTIHRHNWLRTVYQLLSWVIGLVLVLLALAGLMLIVGYVTANDDIIRQAQANVLRDVINIAFIVLALWLDHIQSIVISALLGMMLPTILKDKVQLRTLAPIIYLMTQLLTYLIVLLLYFVITAIMTGIWGTAFLVSTMIVSLTLISLYLLRETIISVLIRWIHLRYDVFDYEATQFN